MGVNNKVAVVTGSSSGIGFETSLVLARDNFHTYATMRNPERGTKMRAVQSGENLPPCRHCKTGAFWEIRL